MNLLLTKRWSVEPGLCMGESLEAGQPTKGPLANSGKK